MVCTQTRSRFDIQKVIYKNITNFDDAYVKTGTWKELKAQEVALSGAGEVIETPFVSNLKELNPQKNTGRQKAELTFKRKIDTELLVKHQDLIEQGLGRLDSTTSYSSTVDGAGSTTTVIDLADDPTTNVVAGDLVQVGDNAPLPVKTVTTGASPSIELEIALPAAPAAGVAVVKRKMFDLSGAEGTNCSDSTFHHFVVLFQDGTAILLEGCTIMMKPELPYEGQAMLDVQIMSARRSELGTGEIPTTITEEDICDPVIVSYQYSQYTDDSDAWVSLFAHEETLSDNRSLEEMKSVGGINNVAGHHIKVMGSFEMEASYDRTDTTIADFSKANESVDRSKLCSQPEIALYFVGCQAHNPDPFVNVNDFGALKIMWNPNFTEDSKVLMVLPE